MPQFNVTQPLNNPRGNLVQQIATRRLKQGQTGIPTPPPVAQEAGAFPTSDVSTQELLQKIAGFRATLGIGG